MKKIEVFSKKIGTPITVSVVGGNVTTDNENIVYAWRKGNWSKGNDSWLKGGWSKGNGNWTNGGWSKGDNWLKGGWSKGNDSWSNGGWSKDSGCYLTTACISAKNLPDDCYELETLRNFRDTYLINQEGGVSDIEDYYETAPCIVENINKSPNSVDVYTDIYTTMVKVCVELIEKKEFINAYNIYKNKVLELKNRYL